MFSFTKRTIQISTISICVLTCSWLMVVACRACNCLGVWRSRGSREFGSDRRVTERADVGRRNVHREIHQRRLGRGEHSGAGQAETGQWEAIPSCRGTFLMWRTMQNIWMIMHVSFSVFWQCLIQCMNMIQTYMYINTSQFAVIIQEVTIRELTSSRGKSLQMRKATSVPNIQSVMRD